MDSWKPIILNNDTIIIKNLNTTIGYARFNVEQLVLEYLFVNRMFRRRGIGTKLVDTAEKVAGSVLRPSEPISPTGRKFFKSKINTL
jgi:GNAT superfamily N-acetyltransferase